MSSFPSRPCRDRYTLHHDARSPRFHGADRAIRSRALVLPCPSSSRATAGVTFPGTELALFRQDTRAREKRTLFANFSFHEVSRKLRLTDVGLNIGFFFCFLFFISPARVSSFALYARNKRFF